MNAPEEELYKRKENDRFRKRYEFNWLSRANSFRYRYYEYLSSIRSGSVVFINSVSPEVTKKEVLKQIESFGLGQYHSATFVIALLHTLQITTRERKNPSNVHAEGGFFYFYKKER